jgi:hypothetical protein
MWWVVNATPRPFYPLERPDTHCIGVWVGLTDGLDRCGKSRPPTWIRFPDGAARSQSLYRLQFHPTLIWTSSIRPLLLRTVSAVLSHVGKTTFKEIHQHLCITSCVSLIHTARFCFQVSRARTPDSLAEMPKRR